MITRTLATLLAILTVACGETAIEPPASASPPKATATATATPAAEKYIRLAVGFDYGTTPPGLERQIVLTGGMLASGVAESYAIREVVERASSARLRLVVWHLSARYASEKILGDKEGFGGRNGPPQLMTIGGLRAFYHSDLDPGFLVWQQARDVVLVYGSDLGVMERLAYELIFSNTPRH